MSEIESMIDAVDIREKVAEFESACLTFDDGVELSIKGATPSIIADFLEYQGFNPAYTSEEAGYIIEWFGARCCQMSLGISDEIGRWNPWRLVCRYRIWKLKKRYF